MGLCSDVAADLVEMHLHGACVGEGEHEGGALGPHGADGAEQVNRCRLSLSSVPIRGTTVQ